MAVGGSLRRLIHARGILKTNIAWFGHAKATPMRTDSLFPLTLTLFHGERIPQLLTRIAPLNPKSDPSPGPLPFGRGEGESSAALWRAEVQGQGTALGCLRTAVGKHRLHYSGALRALTRSRWCSMRRTNRAGEGRGDGDHQDVKSIVAGGDHGELNRLCVNRPDEELGETGAEQ